MTVMQKLGATNMIGGSSLGHEMFDDGLPLNFPVGLRVLVVDDDMTCLMILERLLKNCSYIVTSCSQATSALSLLRDNKNNFDLVLSDVHMPDMDGFKLLELIGLEMDLPVIMMSSDKRTEMVMRGVKHGACDYLIKPVRSEELKNIWQHVARKLRRENKELEHSGSVEDSDKLQRGGDELDNASSVNETNDSGWKSHRKKREAKEEEVDCQHESEEPSTSKKPRVVWSVELHQQFVNAVHQLGVDKAVPKRILELMSVPGLTRENVASHLQKFRLYMKRLSVAQQQQASAIQSQRVGGPGPVDQMGKVGPVNHLDIQSLAASGQLAPQALAAFHAEMLGQAPPLTNPVMPPIDQSTVLLQAPLPLTVDREVLTMGKPMMKYPPGVNVDMGGGGFAGWVPSGQLPVDQVGPTPMVNALQPGGTHHMQVNGLTSGFQIGSSSNNANPFNGEDLMMRFQGHPGVDLQNVMLHQPMGYGHMVQHGGSYMGHMAASGFPTQSGGQGDLQGRNLGFVGRDARIPSRFAGYEFEVQAYGMNQPVVGPNQAGSAQPDGSFGFSPGDIMSVLSK